MHHSVVPPTAGYALDVQRMLDATVPAGGRDHIRVLCDTDMVLHSAVHLMHEGELEMGFRGLLDLDALVNDFVAADPSFWGRLAERAVQLNLQRPAFLALRYTRCILGTDIPETCMYVLREAASGLGDMRLSLLDALYERGLRPHHLSLDDRFSGMARSILYMRAHLLRMPLHLLLPHLLRKSIRRLLDNFSKQEAVNNAQG